MTEDEMRWMWDSVNTVVDTLEQIIGFTDTADEERLREAIDLVVAWHQHNYPESDR